jgi:hypothetical protein
LIEISVKLESRRNKSLISQSLNTSIALKELNKALFNFLSAIESSEIEGAI